MNLPAAIGSLRLADGVGASFDRSVIDGAYYLRLSNTFRADFGLEFEHSRLGVAYGLLLSRNPTTLKLEPFHTAEVRYTYTVPRFMFTLSETAGIGKQTFLGSGRAGALAGLPPLAAPNPATTPPSTPALATPVAIDSSLLPGMQSLLAVTARSAAAATFSWDHALTSTLVIGYQVAGGLSEFARRYMALQHVVDAGIALNYGATARINLVSALVGAHGWNSRSEDYTAFTLSQSVVYRWTAATTVDAGVGVSSRVETLGDGSTALVNTPVASGGISYTLRGRDTTGTFRLGVTYAPAVDPLTAHIENRLSAQGSASLSAGDLTAGIGAGVSQVIPADDPAASTRVGGNAFASYQIVSWLGASLSAQIGHQQYQSTGLNPATPVPSGFTWGLYGGLYAVTPTWRF